MGLFRRREPTAADLEGVARRELGVPGATVTKVTQVKDVWRLPTDGHGRVRESCWFCGAGMEFDPRKAPADAAFVMIEPAGRQGRGTPIHGVCHLACAERAKGSVAPAAPS